MRRDGWMAGSRSTLIVLMKPGNWSHRTRCLTLKLRPGTTSEALNSESRINLTTWDSSPGLQFAARRIRHQRNRVR